MEKTIVLSNIRLLRKFFKKSMLDAYCGLWEIRKNDGRDPEGCLHVNNAAKIFFEKEVEEFRQIINTLHRELNA